MNTICPICGKDDTAPFYDQTLKTHGYECHSCNKDFGVDDESNKIEAYIKALTDFVYKNKKENGDTYIIRIHFDETKTTLEPSIIYANRMCQPYEVQDITPMADSLKNLLFRQMFILDWKKDSLGFLLANNRSFEITMNYKDSALEPTIIKGLASFPPYLKVLDQLFQSFFATEEEK